MSQLESLLLRINKKQVRPRLEKSSLRMMIKKRRLLLTLRPLRRSTKQAQKAKLIPLKLRQKLTLKLPRLRTKQMRKPRTLPALKLRKPTRNSSKMERNQPILQKRQPIKPVLNKKLLMLKSIRLKKTEKHPKQKKLMLIQVALPTLIITKLLAEVLLTEWNLIEKFTFCELIFKHF